MKILSRYLLREHLGPFVFALGALTGLMVLNQVARQFPNLIGKGLPWDVIGAVFGLSMPFIFAMTLPMGVLVAVLHAFSRLGADAEITALKATGVDMVRLVRPVLLAAILTAAGEFLFLDQVLPRSNHQLKILLIDIARKKPTFEMREQVVNEIVPGQLFLRAGRIDQAADRLRDVVIYDLGVPSRRRTIYADSGYLRLNADSTDLFMTLFDGYVHDYDRAARGTFRRIFFGTDLIRVRGVSNRLERTQMDNVRGDREMTLCEMEQRVAAEMIGVNTAARERRALYEQDALALVGVSAPPGDTTPPRAERRTLTALYCSLLTGLRRGLGPAELRAQNPRADRSPGRQRAFARRADGESTAAMRRFPLPPRPVTAPRLAITRGDPSGGQLRGQLAVLDARRRSALQRAASFQVEIHKKYSLAVSCIVFVLIGAPVALRFPRGGVGLVIGASVAIFGIYYIGLIGGETLADGLFIPPYAAMWAPNVLMAALGVFLFLGLNRQHATERGGGWGEAPARLLERWRARRARA